MLQKAPTGPQGSFARVAATRRAGRSSSFRSGTRPRARPRKPWRDYARNVRANAALIGDSLLALVQGPSFRSLSLRARCMSQVAGLFRLQRYVTERTQAS